MNEIKKKLQSQTKSQALTEMKKTILTIIQNEESIKIVNNKITGITYFNDVIINNQDIETINNVIILEDDKKILSQSDQIPNGWYYFNKYCNSIIQTHGDNKEIDVQKIKYIYNCYLYFMSGTLQPNQELSGGGDNTKNAAIFIGFVGLFIVLGTTSIVGAAIFVVGVGIYCADMYHEYSSIPDFFVDLSNIFDGINNKHPINEKDIREIYNQIFIDNKKTINNEITNLINKSFPDGLYVHHFLNLNIIMKDSDLYFDIIQKARDDFNNQIKMPLNNQDKFKEFINDCWYESYNEYLFNSTK